MGRTLAIDIETYSDVDLISCGVYKYSSSLTPKGTIAKAGGGASHSNLQPYIVCYMWKRTA